MSTKFLLALCLLCSTLCPMTSQAAYWSPHVGADWKYWAYHPYPPYDLLFPKIDTAYGLYVGTRINGFFGVDFGYEESQHKTKGITFTGLEEPIFNEPEAANDAARVSIRLNALHLDFNFYWEPYDRFEIIFMAGVAYMKPNSHIFHLTDGVWTEFRNASKVKAVGRYGIGAQYNIMPCLAVKLLFHWESGLRLEEIGLDQFGTPYDITPYHSETNVNLGFVYSFNNPRKHVAYPF